jgi:hypothetical protein
MTTTSYPIKDQPIPHSQWRSLFEGRSGIIGYQAGRTSNLPLTLSSTDNTATVGTGRFDYRGFTLEVTAPHGLTLAPATSADIPYVIGIMYDPAKEGDTLGPLALFAQPKASLTVPTGGSYVMLYGVTRKAATVLSQALPVDFRYYESSPIFWPQSPTGAASGLLGTNPNPADFPYGQVLIQPYPYNVMVRRGGVGTENWDSVTNPAWADLQLAGYLENRIGVAGYRVTDGMLQLSGHVGKSDKTNFGRVPDYARVVIATVPTTATPSVRRIMETSWQGLALRVEIEPTGTIYASPWVAGVNDIPLDNISFRL